MFDVIQRSREKIKIGIGKDSGIINKRNKERNKNRERKRKRKEGGKESGKEGGENTREKTRKGKGKRRVKRTSQRRKGSETRSKWHAHVQRKKLRYLAITPSN
jgi:hypothetical protein